MSKIGIRREDKNQWERRVPLTPAHVRQLVAEGIEVTVQPSTIRAMSDDEYRQAGAQVAEDLSTCPVVFAVKEIPSSLFHAGGAYMYFAHVIKGQPYNMPMLAKLIDLGCTLIDYEKVCDEQGRRLIFFGRHAGLAGMADSLWALGRRLAWEGYQTPFSRLEPAHRYRDLAQLKQAVSEVATRLKQEPLPAALTPMVFGFSGYGNVSAGAQELFDLLPHTTVEPKDLTAMATKTTGQSLIKVVFKEEHMAVPKDATRPFELQEYYQHPERFQAAFDQYLPHLTVLINCIYWTRKYPRLVTIEQLGKLFQDPAQTPRLRLFGDISCDVAGAIECTTQCTETDDPVFVYQVEDGTTVSGVEGKGPVVLAVDNLPCELPVESSLDFGEALLPYVAAIARADFGQDFEKLDLPAPIKRAVITHQGKLAPDYAYLAEKLKLAQEGSS